MAKIISTCKNCGHPIGKVPRGLYVFREDAYRNIRISSSGFHWLHLVEYDGDRKDLGTTEVTEYLDDLKEAEQRLNKIENESTSRNEDLESLQTMVSNLRAQFRLFVNVIKGPERDSRMFVLRCWGRSGKCKCTDPVPEGL